MLFNQRLTRLAYVWKNNRYVFTVSKWLFYVPCFIIHFVSVLFVHLACFTELTFFSENIVFITFMLLSHLQYAF